MLESNILLDIVALISLPLSVFDFVFSVFDWLGVCWSIEWTKRQRQLMKDHPIAILWIQLYYSRTKAPKK